VGHALGGLLRHYVFHEIRLSNVEVTRADMAEVGVEAPQGPDVTVQLHSAAARNVEDSLFSHASTGHQLSYVAVLEIGQLVAGNGAVGSIDPLAQRHLGHDLVHYGDLERRFGQQTAEVAEECFLFRAYAMIRRFPRGLGTLLLSVFSNIHSFPCKSTYLDPIEQ